MPTTLDQLLEAIHPDYTRHVVQRHVDEAINEFLIRSNIVTDAIEYHDIVCRFADSLDRRFGLLPEGTPAPTGVLWERACRLLRKAYGRHGETAAYEIQRAGMEGGLVGVLRQMASKAAEDKVQTEVHTWITAFCNRLSAAEYLATSEEYIRKHRHVLPAEMRSDLAWRARLNLAELLEQHYQLLVRTSQLGR
jgi:hypothetical protein